MSQRGGFRGAGRGRGTYYKNLYGGGAPHQPNHPPSHSEIPPSSQPTAISGPVPLGRNRGNRGDLENELRRLDGKSYGAYKDLQGTSKVNRIHMLLPQKHDSEYRRQQRDSLPAYSKVNRGERPLVEKVNGRNIAFADYVTRRIGQIIKRQGHNIPKVGNWSDAKGGDFNIDSPGQEILQRSSVLVNKEWIEARISIGLPARGRSILGNNALTLFTTCLPYVIQHSLISTAYDLEDVKAFVECVEDQDYLREVITTDDTVVFVPNGAIVPRASGASDIPLKSNVISFQSPPSLEKTYHLPNKGPITGMAIPTGITTIVGGGFHGKSTLLQAISLGIYNHIPGDGREYLVTDPSAVGVRSEDGRSVTSVDISAFISNLPGGARTDKWSSEDASGSTSMAASVVEACELGSKLLLFDEDLCATNFMIRDNIMRKLVKLEPITPLIERIRAIYQMHRISSILVVGGCSDYLTADLVLMMENYHARDVTEKAHGLFVEAHLGEPDPLERQSTPFQSPKERFIVLSTLCSGDRSPKPSSTTTIQMSKSSPELELSALNQLVHRSQTRLIASALWFLKSSADQGALKEEVENFVEEWEDGILNGDGDEGWLAAIRAIDLGMAINRIRGLKVV